MASRRHRPEHDDTVIDLDYGTAGTATKQASRIDRAHHHARNATRDGLRELDAMTRSMGLPPARQARELILPESHSAQVKHPAMRRTLPEPDSVRRPLSTRQRDQRSRAKHQGRAAMSEAQYRAQRDLVTKPAQWTRVNDALAEHVGDVDALSPADQRRIRTIDRSIATAERANDRGHVVYVNAVMPDEVNHLTLDSHLAHHFRPGQRITFDRYTVASHQMHETAGLVHDPAGEVPILEIQTRRGAYLGQSGRGAWTDHLLPRAMEFQVVGVHRASYVDPAGHRRTKSVIQLRDIEGDPT